MRQRDITNPVKRLYNQAEMAQNFLDVISDSLSKCSGIGLGSFEGEEHDISLLFKTYDDESLNIGYADEGDRIYLLDSDFIYKRMKACKNNSMYGDKSEYYSALFEIGAVSDYKYSKSAPLFEICFDRHTDTPYYRECVCIPMNIVNFDISTMKVY